MKIACIIPSRYASTRLPGKPLRLIAGETLVHRVYERAIKAKLPDIVIVATVAISSSGWSIRSCARRSVPVGWSTEVIMT